MKNLTVWSRGVVADMCVVKLNAYSDNFLRLMGVQVVLRCPDHHNQFVISPASHL